MRGCKEAELAAAQERRWHTWHVMRMHAGKKFVSLKEFLGGKQEAPKPRPAGAKPNAFAWHERFNRK